MNHTTEAADFIARRGREHRRHFARAPKKIGNILAQLFTERGYGRVQATQDFTAAWQIAAGPTLSPFTQPGPLKRGKLEITVTNSAVIQELTFQKQQILADLKRQLPDAKITDLRFRIGQIN